MGGGGGGGGVANGLNSERQGHQWHFAFWSDGRGEGGSRLLNL